MERLWVAYSNGRIRADLVERPDGAFVLLPREAEFSSRVYKTLQPALKMLGNFGVVEQKELTEKDEKLSS